MSDVERNAYQRPSGQELQEYRRDYFAKPSWGTMEGILQLRTRNIETRRVLFERHKPLLREYYDAWFNVVTGRGYSKLNRFNQKHLTENNMDAMQRLNPHLNIIRSTLVQPQ